MTYSSGNQPNQGSMTYGQPPNQAISASIPTENQGSTYAPQGGLGMSYSERAVKARVGSGDYGGIAAALDDNGSQNDLTGSKSEKMDSAPQETLPKPYQTIPSSMLQSGVEKVVITPSSIVVFPRSMGSLGGGTGEEKSLLLMSRVSGT